MRSKEEIEEEINRLRSEIQRILKSKLKGGYYPELSTHRKKIKILEWVLNKQKEGK